MERGSQNAIHFDYVDALRGYAILGVIILHVGSRFGLVNQVAWGARGVQLFFVVSALTLVTSWHARQDGARPFYVRRLFRIAPIFWLAIIYYALTSSIGVSVWKIIVSATFLHALWPSTVSPGLVPGGWSISDEAIFYAGFPLLVASLTTWTRSAIALVISMWISAWWRRHGYDWVHSFGYPQVVASDFVFLHPLEQMPAFAAGFLAFHSIRKLNSGQVRYLSETALIIGLLALVWQFARDPHHISRVSFCLCIIVSAIGLGAGRYLVNAVIEHLGLISYSAYFIHFALLETGDALADHYAFTGFYAFSLSLSFVLISTVAISTVAYFLIERPLISFGRSVIARQKSDQNSVRSLEEYRATSCMAVESSEQHRRPYY